MTQHGAFAIRSSLQLRPGLPRVVGLRGGQGTGRPVAVQQEEMLSSALAVTGQEPLVY